jgi:hypothetical protein
MGHPMSDIGPYYRALARIQMQARPGSGSGQRRQPPTRLAGRPAAGSDPGGDRDPESESDSDHSPARRQSPPPGGPAGRRRIPDRGSHEATRMLLSAVT